MSPNPLNVKTKKELPLYRQISNALLSGIREGLFPVGTLLPGELELIERFGSSRHTVREALRVLEDMGIVKRQRGRGTLVISTEARPAFVQAVRDPKELFTYPENSAFRVLAEGHVGDGDHWPVKIGEGVDENWARIAGLRTLHDGSPFVGQTFMYSQIMPRLPSNLAEPHVRFTNRLLRLSARLCSASV